MPSRLRIARCRTSFESRERHSFDSATGCAGSCALVFVEYEVTYRIHYRTGIRSMHAKVEKQAQLEPATLGERGGRTIGRTGERAGGKLYWLCSRLTATVTYVTEASRYRWFKHEATRPSCRVARSAPAAPYFCSCLRPLLLLLPSVHFSFFSLSLFFFPIRHFLFPARSIDWHCLSEAG